MKSTVMNGEYRNVPIATLTESPTNPRKRFDEKALEELAATFKIGSHSGSSCEAI